MGANGEAVKFTGRIQYVGSEKEYAVYGELYKSGTIINGKYYVQPDDVTGGVIRGEIRDGSTLTLRTFRNENGVEIKKTEIVGAMKRGSLRLDGKNGPGNTVRWEINLSPVNNNESVNN